MVLFNDDVFHGSADMKKLQQERFTRVGCTGRVLLVFTVLRDICGSNSSSKPFENNRL